MLGSLQFVTLLRNGTDNLNTAVTYFEQHRDFADRTEIAEPVDLSSNVGLGNRNYSSWFEY